VNVVGNGELALGGRVGAVDSSAEVVFGGLDLDGSELVVVISVQVEVGDDVAKLLENALAGRVARRVRRTHVSRVFADDVADSHLVLDHLVVDLSLGDSREILVRPRVRSDLVTLSNHTPDDRGPGLVDGTLANVDASHEESSLETSCLELVQNLVSVDVRAVVIGNGNSSWLAASVDASTTVRNAAFLRTSIVASASSSRGLVGITSRAEVEKTVRSVAMLCSISTVSSSRAAVTGSTNSVAKTGTAAVVGITSLTSLEVVRALHSSGGASSARRRHPDLDVVGQTEELGGSLNAAMSSDEGGHRGGGENLRETHYVYDITVSFLRKTLRFE
jgi:hypothetical protein